MTAFQIEYAVFLLPPFPSSQLFCQYSFHFIDEDTETECPWDLPKVLLLERGNKYSFFSKMYILCIPGYFWTVISFQCVEKNMFSICFFQAWFRITKCNQSSDWGRDGYFSTNILGISLHFSLALAIRLRPMIPSVQRIWNRMIHYFQVETVNKPVCFSPIYLPHAKVTLEGTC